MNTAAIPGLEDSDGRWKTISIHDKNYLIRAVEIDGGWKVWLTDLVEIWTERLDGPAIFKKCEELNPTLSIEDVDVHEFVRKLLADLPQHATKVSTTRIELNSELEGGIFNFAIDLVKGSALQLWEEVTMPMCLAAGELSRRLDILLELVKAKDEEISEYKLNGAELIRKRIETEPFCDNLFKKNMPAQNADSCQDAFQEIVELHGEVKMERFSIKTEHMETCFAETADTQEAAVIIEAEEKSELKDVDLTTDQVESPKFEGKLASLVQESDNILPKVEVNGSPKLTTTSKASIEINKSSRDSPKRAETTRSSPAKRTKKTIHDFIT